MAISYVTKLNYIRLTWDQAQLSFRFVKKHSGGQGESKIEPDLRFFLQLLGGSR